jgi:hypothetical protein
MALKGRQTATRINSNYYSPVNYVPEPVASESTDMVSAHLKGIDAALEDIVKTTTSTNAQKAIATIILPEDSSLVIEATITAKQTNGNARAGYVRRALYYRIGAAVPSLQNTIDTSLTRTDGSSGYDVTFGVVNNDVVILVTGANGNNVSWTCRYRTTIAP